MDIRPVRWWELPRAKGKQGYIAKAKGTDTPIECPACHNAPIVYNGNYFCDNWVYKPARGDCGWALAHPATSRRDREICDLIGIDYG